MPPYGYCANGGHDPTTTAAPASAPGEHRFNGRCWLSQGLHDMLCRKVFSARERCTCRACAECERTRGRCADNAEAEVA